MAPTNPAGKKVHIRDSYSYLLTGVDGLEVGLQMGFAVIHVDGDAMNVDSLGTSVEVSDLWAYFV